MLTPTPTTTTTTTTPNFNCKSPPFLIKIKRRAKNVTLPVQISLLFCLRRIWFSNFIMQSLSIEFSPRSRQAGDNRGFYCTTASRRCPIWVLYPEPGGPKFHSFLASNARFSKFCSYKSSQFANFFQWDFFELQPGGTRALLDDVIRPN